MDEFNYAYNSMNGGFGFYDPNYYHWIGTHRQEWQDVANTSGGDDKWDLDELQNLLGAGVDAEEVMEYYDWMD